MSKQETLANITAASRQAALYFQSRSAAMTGTELYAEEEYIPEFAAAVIAENMLDRPIGFVCKTNAGRVVKLIQPYDSTVYPGEPETLPAHWGFKWSTDPAKALPFIKLATSPYMTDDCCTENGTVWRSKQESNVYAPSEYPAWWEEVNA